VIARSK